MPIPAASRVANVVMTGGISGMDTKTHAIPDDPDRQVTLMFENLRLILAAAGASPEDVVKVSVSVKSMELRDAINREWVAMFPDEHSRPARHTVQYDYFRGNVVIQCEAYAVLPQ
jgi:enamine deaminase RidA (YjgF/YER057c/UK114 family)